MEAQHLGVTTRMLLDMPTCLYCDAVAGDKHIPIDWRGLRLNGYQPQAKGAVVESAYSETPPHCNGLIHIEGIRESAWIRYSLKPDKPIWLHLGSAETEPNRMDNAYQTVPP